MASIFLIFIFASGHMSPAVCWDGLSLPLDALSTIHSYGKHGTLYEIYCANVETFLGVDVECVTGFGASHKLGLFPVIFC